MNACACCILATATDGAARSVSERVELAVSEDDRRPLVRSDRATGFAAGTTTPEEDAFARALGVAVACAETLESSLTEGLPSEPLPNKPFPRADVAALLAAGAPAVARDLAGYVGPCFGVDRIGLVRSHLGPSPRYESLGSWSLGDAGGVRGE